MKTKEQIMSEGHCGRCEGDVFTLCEFIEMTKRQIILPYDGSGYFHDGENETDKSVWDEDLSILELRKYPYVCWYNK